MQHRNHVRPSMSESTFHLRSLIAAAAAALINAAAGAHAQSTGLIEDVEPLNNAPAGAAALGGPGTRTMIGLMSLTPSDIDFLSVPLSAGDRLMVMTTPLDGEGGALRHPDTIVDVLDTNGSTVLVSNDDAGTDFAGGLTIVRGSVVRFLAPASGFYFVRVRGFVASSEGPYLLTLSIKASGATSVIEAANNSPAEAPLLRPDLAGPIAISGSINPAGEADWIALELNDGDILSAMTSQVADFTDFCCPPLHLQLFGPDGVSILAESSSAGANFPSFGTAFGNVIRLRAPAAGRYYLRLAGQQPANAGAYHMLLSVLAAAPENSCSSDLNGDGQTNASDLSLLLTSWGACP